MQANQKALPTSFARTCKNQRLSTKLVPEGRSRCALLVLQQAADLINHAFLVRPRPRFWLASPFSCANSWESLVPGLEKSLHTIL